LDRHDARGRRFETQQSRNSEEAHTMNRFLSGLVTAALLLTTVGLAHAWHLDGRVLCPGNGLALANVTIEVSNTDGENFYASTTTDENGYYFIPLPDSPRCYRAKAVVGEGESVVSPQSGDYRFCTTDTEFELTRDWIVDSPACKEGEGEEEGLCWLTAGGAKFSPIIGQRVGEHGPHHNWGGNVYPGCSPTAGDGGSWNHVAHILKLHFQGRTIHVIRCGNVDGIPPGSDSPRTPFNFIEFEGSGTLKGIKGNKVNHGTVHFFARCEDRNEPGSSGQRDGNLKDRYFLHVYSNPDNPHGSTLLLVDVDGNSATVDPVTITDGNMQIHASSCDNEPTMAFAPIRAAAPQGTDAAMEDAWLSVGPNPTRHLAFVRFRLQRDANVSLAAFDLAGRKVSEWRSARLGPGEHALSWSLIDRDGRRLGSGLYFLRLDVEGRVFTRPVNIVP
jgi:hypothetical protein